MNVLITGGAGFLGLNLVRAAAQAGCSVVSVDRDAFDSCGSDYLSGVADSVVQVGTDVSAPEWWRAVPTLEYDLLIHAAAVTPVPGVGELAAYERAVTTNVLGTVFVLRWAVQANVRRAIFVSSASVYGANATPGGIVEDTCLAPDDVYGVTKAAAERIALRVGDTTDLDLRVVRPTQLYGPMERRTEGRDTLSPICDWCRQLIEGRRMARCEIDFSRDYTYVQDAADAIWSIAVCQHLSWRTYNVSTGRDVSLKRILATLRDLGQETGRDVCEQGAEFSVSVPWGYRAPLVASRLRRDTGWRPRFDIRNGLRSYLAWLSGNPGEAARFVAE